MFAGLQGLKALLCFMFLGLPVFKIKAWRFYNFCRSPTAPNLSFYVFSDLLGLKTLGF